MHDAERSRLYTRDEIVPRELPRESREVASRIFSFLRGGNLEEKAAPISSPRNLSEKKREKIDNTLSPEFSNEFYISGFTGLYVTGIV